MPSLVAIETISVHQITLLYSYTLNTEIFVLKGNIEAYAPCNTSNKPHINTSTAIPD